MKKILCLLAFSAVFGILSLHAKKPTKISTVSPYNKQQSLGNASSSEKIFSLEPNEEYVYGKVGLHDNGTVKYTFAITRKPNSSKELYIREKLFPYSGSQPLQGGGTMRRNNNPADYDLFDYFVVFNGEKLGPYDRIYEMQQDEGNVDYWVSGSGNEISFASVKGQRYWPIISNRTYPSFWSVRQAPIYCPASGKATFAIQWGQNSFRLFENGRLKYDGWSSIKALEYSDDGENLLYIGAEKNPRELYVFVNHEKIAGPFNIVNHVGAGFIPKTNIPYAVGFNNDVVDGRSVANYGHVTIGSKKIPVPDGHQVGNLSFAGNWVSFIVTEVHPNQNNVFKDKTHTIYEYNYKTNELKKHDGYGYHTAVLSTAGNTFYYSAYSQNGDALLVKQGGEVLYRVPRSQRGGDGNIYFRVGKNGDFFTVITDSNDKQRVLYNGKPYGPAAIDFATIRYAGFCAETGKPQMVIALDKPVGATQRRFINGENYFNLEGDFGSDHQRIFATKSNDIFHIEREVLGPNNRRHRVFKNSKPMHSKQYRFIAQLTISPDGRRFAALVSNSSNPNATLNFYHTENIQMHEKRSLMVDGKIIEGNFGAPIWSSQKQKFIVLQQVGNDIQLVGL